MNQALSTIGYQQTQAKLKSLERRLADVEGRQDLAPDHKAAVIRSFRSMARQYLREIKLYEARNQASSNP